MTATLRKDLGEAGAFLGDKLVGLKGHNLRDVLVEMILGPKDLNGKQDTIATGTIAAMLVKRPGFLNGLRTSVGTTGTADSTTLQVHVNGVSKGELTTANTEADGTKKALALSTPLALAVGDLVELVVSAAPTAGADLAATAEIGPDIVVE